MEEFRINPRFLIWMIRKMGSSINYNLKAVRRESLRVSKHSTMTLLHARSPQQTTGDTGSRAQDRGIAWSKQCLPESNQCWELILGEQIKSSWVRREKGQV